MRMIAMTMICAVFVLTAGQLAAHGQKKPSSDTPATSTILDVDPVNGTVFKIGNDSLGPYRNNVDSVVSIVQGIGNWVMDTNPSPLRRVRLDFSDPVPNTGANPPFQTAFVPLRFISKCTTSIFTLALNQSISCPLALGAIQYNGQSYALRSESTNYPGTEPVTWTCNARDATRCVSWTMTPSVVQADGERKIVMQLLKPATRPRDADILLGRFYMSFHVNVTTP